MKEPLSCLRCGKCCFVDLTAYAEKEDFDHWRHQRNSASRPACLCIPGIRRAGCRVEGAWIEVRRAWESRPTAVTFKLCVN